MSIFGDSAEDKMGNAISIVVVVAVFVVVAAIIWALS